MKKFLAIILMAILLTASASADMIWEPDNDNTFYYENKEDMTHINRRYTVTQDTILRKEPDGKKAGVAKTGGEINITYVYYNDKGICYGLFINGDDELWIDMAYTKLVYDSQAFLDEYGNELTNFEDDKTLFENVTSIKYYSYPLSDSFIENTMEAPTISQIYTDKNGGRWGYVAYHYGIRQAWVYIDAPDAVIEAQPKTTSEDYTGLPKKPVLTDKNKATAKDYIEKIEENTTNDDIIPDVEIELDSPYEEETEITDNYIIIDEQQDENMSPITTALTVLLIIVAAAVAIVVITLKYSKR